jgi:hypothetical protein
VVTDVKVLNAARAINAQLGIAVVRFVQFNQNLKRKAKLLLLY